MGHRLSLARDFVPPCIDMRQELSRNLTVFIARRAAVSGKPA
jgi:hypothetical protein